VTPRRVRPARQASELERLEHHVADVRERLADIEHQVGRANHDLDALAFRQRRGSEGNEVRRGLRQLHARHGRAEEDRAKALDSMEEIRRENDPFAWVEHHSEQIRDLRAVEQEIGARDRHAEHHDTSPRARRPCAGISAGSRARPG
jgi:predicted  nucleic acid-binding Zn-ribbon protein